MIHNLEARNPFNCRHGSLPLQDLSNCGAIDKVLETYNYCSKKYQMKIQNFR